MNYRHAYHAGNFADVTKHIGLLCLLDRLRAKDKPFCVLDTHGGRGGYDLESTEARRSGEAVGGILRLDRMTSLPEAAQRLLDLVRSLQPESGSVRFYPGSPEIIRRRLREDDRAVVCELQPQEARCLRARYAADRRVAVHHRDGYAAIRALLPPTPRRGFVFIDPPYEAPDEFDRVTAAVAEGLRRWPGGIFLVWYPIKDTRELNRFRRTLATGDFGPVMTAEFTVRSADHSARLNGSGLAVVHPPWGLEGILARIWSELPRLLGKEDTARADIRWLHPPDGGASSAARDWRHDRRLAGSPVHRGRC